MGRLHAAVNWMSPLVKWPFMALHRMGDRTAAAVLGAMLLGIGYMAADSGPPTIGIADVDAVEDGAVVRLQGVLAHAWRYDSGLETLLLADLGDGSTVKLAHQVTGPTAFTSLLSIGDEVSSVGEVRRSGESTTMWVSDDGIRLMRQSEAVLSVDAICRNWLLFEGDPLNVSGLLQPGSLPGDLVLSDREGGARIALFDPPSGLDGLLGRAVVLECELQLSTEEMRFGLLVRSYASVAP
ncbi:MAG: hypothetical protein MUE55_04680 [Thermoplasmata archaeon]|jgi:hypothetical protein|nr:hypothetical protein [Thermoplasmata archaeon]